jgi:formylglycine-generating enzyme
MGTRFSRVICTLYAGWVAVWPSALNTFADDLRGVGLEFDRVRKTFVTSGEAGRGPDDENLVFIPPGTFTMGSPVDQALRNPDETQHTVTITQGFWMGRHLVTQGEYLLIMRNNPSFFAPADGYAYDPNLPVERVNWFDATDYCKLRTRLEQSAGLIPENYLYRLPTEAEWEYAARAGTTTAFYLGGSLLSGEANFDGRREYYS